MVIGMCVKGIPGTEVSRRKGNDGNTKGASGIKSKVVSQTEPFLGKPRIPGQEVWTLLSHGEPGEISE